MQGLQCAQSAEHRHGLQCECIESVEHKLPASTIHISPLKSAECMQSLVYEESAECMKSTV